MCSYDFMAVFKLNDVSGAIATYSPGHYLSFFYCRNNPWLFGTEHYNVSNELYPVPCRDFELNTGMSVDRWHELKYLNLYLESRRCIIASLVACIVFHQSGAMEHISAEGSQGTTIINVSLKVKTGNHVNNAGLGCTINWIWSKLQYWQSRC